MDQFYAIVTGDKDAFFKVCMALPETIREVISDSDIVSVPEDSVYEELKKKANAIQINDEELSMAIAVYLLGFSSYTGFDDIQRMARLTSYVEKVNDKSAI